MTRWSDGFELNVADISCEDLLTTVAGNCVGEDSLHEQTSSVRETDEFVGPRRSHLRNFRTMLGELYVISLPNALKQDVDDHRACERCELLVRVTHAQRTKTTASFAAIRQSARGSRGLSLVAALPEPMWEEVVLENCHALEEVVDLRSWLKM